jgi:hypothetical protein
MDVTLRLPPDVQLDLNRALPPPLVVLPASGAIQYEFRVVESLLGNQINSSHWFAVGATAVNDARQQIHGLLLFVLSATFGVGVALLIEGLIARPSET